MEKIKGFKNSWILSEEGIIKTNLIIKDSKIFKIGDYQEDGLIELDDDKMNKALLELLTIRMSVVL